MNVQVIQRNGKPEWAVIPYEEYEQLLEQVEMLQDIHAYDEAKQAIADGEELIPSEIIYAILDGENPVRVWRTYRGLSQAQLASAANISVAYLAEIESGTRQATTTEMSALAEALGLDLDDLAVPQHQA
jgi:DNA-binding XRE family transcriptional regulator